MTSSLGVCQCHGTLQPGASLTITIDGPFLGSPRTGATVAQLGMIGTGANLATFGSNVMTAPGSAACAVGGPLTATAAQSPTSRAPIRIVHTFMDHPSHIHGLGSTFAAERG